MPYISTLTLRKFGKQGVQSLSRTRRNTFYPWEEEHVRIAINALADQYTIYLRKGMYVMDN